MKVEGGCYCGSVRYRAEGEPVIKAQCHCRECQYMSGGSPNVTMGMPGATFQYTKGTPKAFKRSDLATPVTREFCDNCGTHIASLAPHALPNVVLLKVGTFDDPKQFGGPDLVIFTVDKQPFHQQPTGIPSFERMPG